jgi:hypothetical protein
MTKSPEVTTTPVGGAPTIMPPGATSRDLAVPGLVQRLEEALRAGDLGRATELAGLLRGAA